MVTAVLAAVLAGAAVTGVAACGPQRAAGPVGAPAASNVDTAGLDVLGDNTIHRPDGSRVALALPAGVHVLGALTTPDGWLLEALAPDERELWYAPATGGPARRIGALAGNYAVSPDGRTLVAVGPGAAAGPGGAVGPGAAGGSGAAVAMLGAVVVAYELPALREGRRLRWPGGAAPLVRGVGPDRVLLSEAPGSPGPAPAVVWDLSDGRLRDTPAASWAWSVSRTGEVLLRTDRPDGACLAVLSEADLPDSGGLCDPVVKQVIGGSVAPTGEGVALELMDSAGAGGLVQVTLTDLRAGRWRPRPLHPTGTLAFWDADLDVDDSDAAAILQVDGDTYVRCAGTGPCRTLVLPQVPVSPELSAPVLVPRAG